MGGVGSGRPTVRKDTETALLDLMLQVTKILVDKGIKKEKAVIIAQEAAEFMGRHWNGSSVYFSFKKLSFRLAEAELIKNFDGSRDFILALARKHNVTQTFIYETLKKIRERFKEAREKVVDRQGPQRGQ